MDDEITVISATFDNTWLEVSFLDVGHTTQRVRELGVLQIDPTLVATDIADVKEVLAGIVRVALIERRATPAELDAARTIMSVSFNEAAVEVSTLEDQTGSRVREVKALQVPNDMVAEAIEDMQSSLRNAIEVAQIDQRNPPESFVGLTSSRP